MRGSSEKVYESSSFINLLSVASLSPDNGTVKRLQGQIISDMQAQALCQSKMATSTTIMTSLLVASPPCISFFTEDSKGCTKS